MYRDGDFPPEIWEEQKRSLGEFALCETTAEVLVLVQALLGLDAVNGLLVTLGGTREKLRSAADEIGRAGLTDLAKLVRKHARKAKPAPPSTWNGQRFRRLSVP